MTQTNDGGATDLTTDALKRLAGELEVEARHHRHGDGLAALFWNARSAVLGLIERREADERQRNALALALDALVDAKKDWWREAAPQWNMADFLEWATVRKMTVAISAIRAATPTTEASHGE